MTGGAFHLPMSSASHKLPNASTRDYYGLGVSSMRQACRSIDDEVLAHISLANYRHLYAKAAGQRPPVSCGDLP